MGFMAVHHDVCLCRCTHVPMFARRLQPHGQGHASRPWSRRLCKAAFYALWLFFFAWLLGGLSGYTSGGEA